MPSTPTFMTLLGEVRQQCVQPKTSHLEVYAQKLVYFFNALTSFVLLGCRNSFEVFRAPFRPHQGSLASAGSRCHRSIPWAAGLSGPDIQKGGGAGLIPCTHGFVFLGVPTNAHFPDRVCRRQ